MALSKKQLQRAAMLKYARQKGRSIAKNMESGRGPNNRRRVERARNLPARDNDAVGRRGMNAVSQMNKQSIADYKKKYPTGDPSESGITDGYTAAQRAANLRIKASSKGLPNYDPKIHGKRINYTDSEAPGFTEGQMKYNPHPEIYDKVVLNKSGIGQTIYLGKKATDMVKSDARKAERNLRNPKSEFNRNWGRMSPAQRRRENRGS